MQWAQDWANATSSRCAIFLQCANVRCEQGFLFTLVDRAKSAGRSSEQDEHLVGVMAGPTRGLGQFGQLSWDTYLSPCSALRWTQYGSRIFWGLVLGSSMQIWKNGQNPVKMRSNRNALDLKAKSVNLHAVTFICNFDSSCQHISDIWRVAWIPFMRTKSTTNWVTQESGYFHDLGRWIKLD